MKKSAFLISLSFLIVGVLTLGDYGISWDSPVHFQRGQAYLWYFLTGKKTYAGLPKYDLYKSQTDASYHERSFYQVEDILRTGKHPKDFDRGHPPTSDILAALSNFIFYQKLGWLEDLEAYNLFYLFASALAVGVVFLFASETFGTRAGIISSIFLATYPLFWAESHFNIKDPSQTAFFSLSLYSLWKGISGTSRKYILLSSVFAGFALGTKFNILFLPFILGPWILSLWINKGGEIKKVIFSKKILLALFGFLPLMFLVFFAFWPFLWSDPIGHTLKTFAYYEKIGTEGSYQPDFLFGPINLYAFSWILFTTPPIMLIAFVFGLFAFRKNWQKFDGVFLLWLLWFLVPILRVSFSGLSIYGGVRQVMEFLPAMALVSGVGVDWLLSITGGKFKQVRSFPFLIVILIFTFLTFNLARLRPYENTYFNFLVDGLRGAQDKKIPAAGNTFGNAYLEGIDWLNSNVEEEAKLAIIQGATANLSLFKLRPDIDYQNVHWSGIERGGEYLMELTYNYDVRSYHYAWEYAEKMLDPVYEVKADGVPVLKIWKNDLANTKPEYRKSEKSYSGFEQKVEDGKLILAFDQEKLLTRVMADYDQSASCRPLTPQSILYIESSVDALSWFREKDWVPFEQVGRTTNLQGDSFVFYFAARPARFLRFAPQDQDSCIFKNHKVEVRVLD